MTTRTESREEYALRKGLWAASRNKPRRYTENHVPRHLQLRVYYDTELRNPDSPHRWRTTAYLIDSNGVCRATGVAECSERDNPNRKVGRAIAVGRALKSYHLNREQARFWTGHRAA